MSKEGVSGSKHVCHHYHRYSKASNVKLLTCALLAALSTGGPVYSFGLWGGELKSHLELTQAQLDTISSASFCAGLFSWIPGLMIDHLGIKLSLVVGGICGSTLLTLYWAIAKQVIHVHTDFILPLLCGVGILIFMSNSLVTGGVFKLIVSTSAPNTKGSIVGAAKGYVGLGSGLYACLFRSIKTPNVQDLDFLLMAAVLAFSAATIPALVFLPNRDELDKIIQSTPVVDLDQTTATHLRCLYFGLILLATMVVGTTIVSIVGDDYDSKLYHDENKTYNIETEPIQVELDLVKAILIISAWIVPILALLVVPPKSTLFHENKKYESLADAIVSSERDDDDGERTDDDDNHESKPLVKSRSSPALAYGAEITDSRHAPRGSLGRKAIKAMVSGVSSDDDPQALSSREASPLDVLEPPNYTLLEMLQTLPAWLFCFITVIRVGGGTMVTNNMGQMVESLRLPKHTTTPAALALFSVAQALSRVLTGTLSDWMIGLDTIQETFTYHKKEYNIVLDMTTSGIPRPAFLIFASLAGTFAHIFMSLTITRNWFLVGVCFSGVAFGTIWPLVSDTTRRCILTEEE
jgi:hypothetical protein